MQYYGRIDISEGIDINKTSTLKESDICHYWHFLNKGFKFQLYVCNSCHDVLMSLNLNDVSILNINSANYCCIINRISKSNAANLLQNANLTEERRVL